MCPTPQTEKTVSVDLATLGQQRRTQPQLPSHNAGRLCLQQKHCDNKKGCSSLCLKHRGADSSDGRLKEHQGFVYNHPKNFMYVGIEVTTEDNGRIYIHTNTTVSEGPSLRVLSGFSTVGSPDVVCWSHILQPPGGNLCNHSRVFWDCQ